MTHIGDRCVHCGEDTALGSGRFVNRIPSGTDCEIIDENGKIIFAGGEYREGYQCVECQSLECDRCGMLTADYIFADHIGQKTFYDDSEYICEFCLTEEENAAWEQLNA